MVSIRALPPDEHLHAIRGDGVLYLPAVVLKPEMIYISEGARVDSGCKLEGGEGIHIGPMVHVAFGCHLNVGGGTLIMEEGSSCASHCVIVTGSGDYKAGVGCSAVSPAVVNKKGRVVIKRNATLYVGCVVRPGVTIGEGATVAMGSVVLHDVPPGELWGGNPARLLSHAISGKEQTKLAEMGVYPESSRQAVLDGLRKIRTTVTDAVGIQVDNRPPLTGKASVDRFVEGQAEWYD
jgi:acetyltransferase-like isoleucine patch superfamily enzyme